MIRDQYGQPYLLSYCVKEFNLQDEDVDIAIVGFSKTVYKGKAPLEILSFQTIYLLSFCNDAIAIVNEKTKTKRIMKAC